MTAAISIFRGEHRGENLTKTARSIRDRLWVPRGSGSMLAHQQADLVGPALCPHRTRMLSPEHDSG